MGAFDLTSPGIVTTHREEIIDRVANGEKVSTIAASLGIDRKTIQRHLADDPDYQAAQIAYHATRLDQCEDMLEEAATHEDVASRASRAQSASAWWRSVSWRAEREQRRIWGNEPSVVINTGVSSDQALGQSALSLLDKLRTVATQGKDDPGG